MNMQKSKPVSFSMMVDVTPSRDADFKGIQSRSLDTWVDDSSALSCFGCKEPLDMVFYHLELVIVECVGEPFVHIAVARLL